MGYADVTTLTAPDVAVDAGVLTPSQAIAFGMAEDGIIRDDAAAILYGAAMYGENADGQKFIDALIESGFVKEEDAIKAGFKEDPKAGELAVVDVRAINLAQIEVVFNKEISEDDLEAIEKSDNYKFEDEDGRKFRGQDSKTVVVSDVNVDGNVATLFIGGTPAKNQSECIIIIDEDITGEELDFDLKFSDFSIPTIEDAEVIGKNTIKIVFSEPMKISGNKASYFEVKDESGKTNYRVRSTEAQAQNKEILVEVRSDLKDGDDIVVKIDNGLEDFAGFKLVKQSIDLTVEEDDREIEVVGYRKASETGITLIFNKDIKVDDNDNKNVYHTNSKNYSDNFDADGKELEIVFEEHELPTGTAYVYVDGETLVDYWGNKNEETIRVIVEIAGDKEAPKIEEIKDVTNRGLTIVFNEKLDADSAKDKDNYAILDADGKELKDIDVRKAVYNDSNKTVTLTFDKLSVGEYILVVENVEDARGNKIGYIEETFEIEGNALNLNDSDDVDVEFFKNDEGDYVEWTIIVEYGRAMTTGSDRYSIANLDNYTVKLNNNKYYTLNDLADEDHYSVDFTLVNDKVVEIVIEVEVEVDDDHVPVSFFISRVKDAQGVLSEQLVSNEILFSAAEDTFAIDGKPEAVALDEIVVKFDAAIDYLVDEEFVFLAGEEVGEDREDVTDELVASITLSDDGKKLTFKLNDDVLTAAAKYAEDGSDIYLSVTDSKTETRFGQTLEAFDIKVVDKINPEFDSEYGEAGFEFGYNVTTGTNIVIELMFTEDVKVLDDYELYNIASTLKVFDNDGDELSFAGEWNDSATLESDEFAIYKDADATDTIKIIVNGGLEDVIEIEFTSNRFFVDANDNQVLSFTADVVID